MGNVNVNGGSLEWSASIDDTGLNDSLKQINSDLDKTYQKQVQQADQAAKAQQQYAQTIIATGQAFRNLGDNIQGQFRNLNSLTIELQKVRDAKDQLTKRQDLGIIGADTANNSMAALIAKENELSAAIERTSQDMQTSDAIMRAASGSIVQRTLQLQQLKQQYSELSEADRNNATIGGGLLSKIQGIDAELKSVNQSFQSVEQHAVGSINSKVSALSDLKRQYSALAETDRNSDIGKTMLSNIQRVEKEVDVLNSSFKSVTQNAVGSLNAKVAQVNELKNQFAALSDVERRSDLGKSLSKNIKGLDKEIQGINNQFSTTNDLATRAAVAIGSFLSLQAGTNFIKSVVEVRGQFQQLEVAFNTMLGTKEKADKLMAEVVQLAATTPFTLQDVGGAAKQLLAYGTAADKVTDTVRRLGDVASGVGAPINDIVYLYGTLQVQGRAYQRDIIQFQQRGIDIVGGLAKQFGKQKEEISAMVEAGKIGFPEVEAAIKSMTSEGGLFFNLMEKQSHTLTGMLSNLQDAWSRMLNAIGHSNEGVLSGAIQGATTLVNHYEDVIRILKILVVTYGTYRAATLASIVVQRVQQEVLLQSALAGRSLSVAQGLQAATAAIAQRSMAALNATLLANPAVLVATGITLLIGTLTFLKNKQYEVKTSTELLKDSQEKATETFTRQEAEIKQYVATLQDQNIAESTRLEAYNKLKEIAPDIIGQLTYQAAKTADLTAATNTYIASLRQRITLEAKQSAYAEALKKRDELFNKAKPFIGKDGKANDGGVLDILNPFSNSSIKASEGELAINAYKEAAAVVIDVEKDIKTAMGGTKEAIEFQIKSLQDQNRVLDKTSSAYRDNEIQINSLKKSLAALSNQKPAGKSLSEFLADQANLLKNFDQIVKLITNKDQADLVKKALTEKMESFAPGDQAKEAYKKKIQEVNKLIASYGVESNKSALKQQETLDTKTNSLLETRKGLLQSIADLQRGAKQSGLVKEQSELDKINEKYDNLIDKLLDFNSKVDEFNKKNKTNVQKVGVLDINALQQSRVKEVGNTVLIKQGSEDFKKDLEQQKKVFEDFQAAVKDIGVEKAQEIFGEQTKGFTSFLAFLQSESKKNINLVNPEKIKALNEAIVDEEKKNEEELFKQRIENFKRLFVETADFNTKRLAYEKQYEKDVAELRKTYSGAELEERLKVLKESKDADLKNLGESLAQQTAGYRALHQTATNFAKQRIQQEIDGLKKLLDNPNLDKNTRNAIKAAIDQWEGLKHAIDGTDDKINQFISDANKVAGIFSDIADGVQGINSGLSDSLHFIATMITSISKAKGQWKDFKGEVNKLQDGTGSILGTLSAAGGLVGTAVGIISAVVGVFKKSREERLKAQKEVQDFYDNVAKGEFEITEQYRQRQREQVKLNKLKLDGLEAEKKVLLDQKQAVADQYNSLLQQLQQQSAVIGETTKKKGGFLGIGKKTQVVEITQTLAGQTFDQLEELFNKGQLTGKAKDLFEMLQKVKQEGVDIDALIKQNEEEAAQIFTGTTFDSIVSSIADGFRNGLHSATDFAGTFEDLMRNAMISSLKFQFLEPAMKDFFDKFSEFSQSGGQLDQSEIDNLKTIFNTSISNFDDKLKQFEQVSGINLQTSSSNTSSLAGAIKSITEDTAELIAGNMSGLRLTAIQQLEIMQQALTVQQNVANNTALTVGRLDKLLQKFTDYETGSKKLSIQ